MNSLSASEFDDYPAKMSRSRNTDRGSLENQNCPRSVFS